MRNIRFELPLSQAEKDAWAKAALADGLPLATYVRHTINKHVATLAPPAKPAGRPGKTVADLVANRTSHAHPAFPDGTPRMNAIMSDPAFKFFVDDIEAHRAAVRDVEKSFASGGKMEPWTNRELYKYMKGKGGVS